MRVLILGGTGMLGNSVLRYFVNAGQHQVWATVRNDAAKKLFAEKIQSHLVSGVDVLNDGQLMEVFAKVKPEIVINCVGIIKQLENANDPLAVLPINALLPHRLATLCKVADARLIHVSTDCVFSGDKGGYTEADISDARDLYGKSKFMGEVINEDHAITLRTSIIGHELNSQYALIDWFLAQQDQIKGFKKAIFSGLPTIELAAVMHDWVIPQKNLHGLHHVSAKPISKFDLLQLVAEKYSKKIDILADETMVIDRSLNSSRFQNLSGYQPEPWPVLIQKMHQDFKELN